MATKPPIAHRIPETNTLHLLEDHLRGVAGLAASFADRFGAARWAELAGRWHDLGKYTREFQGYIWGDDGDDAHLETTATGPNGRPDHSSVGAVYAKEKLGAAGSVLPFVIAGHHAGLPDADKLRERLVRKAPLVDLALKANPPSDILGCDPLDPPEFMRQGSPRSRHHAEFWVRMLFSALCDADFLDTEHFYDPDRAAERRVEPCLSDMRKQLALYMNRLELESQARGVNEVHRVRQEVRQACSAAAVLAPGFFSLTVPTGGGKTLASLAFALDHAICQNLDRVVVAIPYTSILEQTAACYRQALGVEGSASILEHHSALDPSEETRWNRLASENWDAPVIVTTTVQLLESLFSNRTSRCRKLHRLARSVIIFDEAQTLPPGLLLPILDGLRTLVDDYGSSIVIATATQPAFRKSNSLKDGWDGVREIMPDPEDSFRRLKRVRVVWPSASMPTTYEALAKAAATEPDVLVVVHKRDDARRVCTLMDQELGDSSTLHLSALMCAEHRSSVLAEIKARKARGEPVRLVATQLVEAGVDLDFAVVYRALGGIDSLAQAAGRCNREGRLAHLGELRVFLAPTKPPQGVPSTALAVAKGMLEESAAGELELFCSDTYGRYFRQLYGTVDLDKAGVQEARGRLHFETVAERFQMIEDGWSSAVVVPYGDGPARVAEIEKAGPTRNRLRALQRYTVQIRTGIANTWLGSGVLRNVANTVMVMDPLFAAAYEDRFGLVPDHIGQADPGALIVDG